MDKEMTPEKVKEYLRNKNDNWFNIKERPMIELAKAYLAKCEQSQRLQSLLDEINDMVGEISTKNPSLFREIKDIFGNPKPSTITPESLKITAQTIADIGKKSNYKRYTSTSMENQGLQKELSKMKSIINKQQEALNMALGYIEEVGTGLPKPYTLIKIEQALALTQQNENK